MDTCFIKTWTIYGVLGLYSALGMAQQKDSGDIQLSVMFEALTTPQFVEAVSRSEGVCLLPFGILEKHGPHLPLGTDLIICRELALNAAEREYCVVFPEYYFGQIYEAKHQPGTIAYSPELIYQLLQETCDELSRNGFKKIIIVNGHGGNRHFIHYFCQTQLASKKEYAVVFFMPTENPEFNEKIRSLKETEEDGHAGESETSEVLVSRPEWVHLEKARDQSGENLNRLKDIPALATGIWWYARYPNHYSGDGSYAKEALGEMLINEGVEQLVAFIKTVKSNRTLLELQNQFYKASAYPLETEQ